MKDRIISLNTSKIAKEKGFDIPSIYGYDSNGELEEYFTYASYSPGEPEIRIDDFICKWEYQAPTQSLLQAWLREVHDIHIQILIYSWSERTYYYKIHSKRACVSNSSKFILDSDVVIGRYVDVLEKALHHGLNLIKE